MICVNIIEHGLFDTIETACRWNVFSSSVTRRKCHKSRFRTFKFKSVLNSVSTTCTCNTNSGTLCSPESKHWFVRVFAQDTNTNTNFSLNIFHQQLVKLFEAKNKHLHAALTEEDLGHILSEIDDLKIIYNLADGKLLHVIKRSARNNPDSRRVILFANK